MNKAWGILNGGAFFISLIVIPLGGGLTTTRLAIIFFALLLIIRLKSVNYLINFRLILFLASFIAAVAFLASSFTANMTSIFNERIVLEQHNYALDAIKRNPSYNFVLSPYALTNGYSSTKPIPVQKENVKKNFNGEKTAGLLEGDGWTSYILANTQFNHQYLTTWILKAGTNSSARLSWGGNHQGNRTNLSVNLIDGSIYDVTQLPNEVFGTLSLGNGWWAVYYSSTLISGSNYYPRLINEEGSLYFGGLQIEELEQGKLTPATLSEKIVFRAKHSWSLVSWIFLGLLSVLGANSTGLMRNRQLDHFVWSLVFLFAVLFGIITIHVVNSSIPLLKIHDIRRSLDLFFPAGLSRLVNMMTVVSGIILGVFCLKNRSDRKSYDYLYLFPIIATLSLAFFTGSRQGIISVVIIVLLALFTERKSVIIILGTLSIAILLFITTVFVLSRSDELDNNYVDHRFISQSHRKSLQQSNNERLVTIQTAWSAALSGGLGPGNFTRTTGLYPHNGYLGFLAEAGLIKGGIALLAIWGIIIYTFIRLRRRYDLSPLARSAWVVFLVLATVMNMFNDLFREPIYWATLGLAVGASVASPFRGEAAPADDGENDKNLNTPNAG